MDDDALELFLKAFHSCTILNHARREVVVDLDQTQQTAFDIILLAAELLELEPALRDRKASAKDIAKR